MAAPGERRLSRPGEKPDREWIWGRHAALEALRSDRDLREIWVARSSRPALIAEIRVAAEERMVPVRLVDRARLDAVTNRHQGVIARATGFPYADLDAVLARAGARGEPPLIVIADGIQDPQNLGTLIRTLEAVGGHGLILARHRAVGITPGVIKASAGAVQFLTIAQVPNIPRAVESLRAQRVWVAGLDAKAAGRLDDLPAGDGLALAIGNEAEGLSRLTKERCDFLVGLPTSGRVQSLNAAVAASIALYDVWRRRHQAPRS